MLIVNRAILRKLLYPDLIIYLLEYAFTLPPISIYCIIRDSVNRLVTLTVNLLNSKLVHGLLV